MKTISQRVLVTGSAGRLGRAVVSELLARGHHVTGFDRVPTPGLPVDHSIVDSIQNGDAVLRAAEGVQSLIHLAATPDDALFPRGLPPDDSDNFVSELMPNNILGGYHVMEAARRLNIPRVILASTGQVIDGHLDAGAVPVTASTPFRPRYLYACTKVFLEAIGQAYADQHGLSVLAVRLGWCPRDAGQVRQLSQSPEDQDVYLSPGDAGRYFAAAVAAPDWKGFKVNYVTSQPIQHLLYDLEPAKRLTGFVPSDRWPVGAESF